MEPLEISAQTVDEAVTIALDQLSASRNEVRVDVLSEGRTGILGIGTAQARIRVQLLTPGNVAEDDADSAESVDEVNGNVFAPEAELPPDIDGNIDQTARYATADSEVTETAVAVIERLLELLEINGTVESAPLTLASDENPAAAPPSFNITGDNLGILIGRRGQTLTALQYVSRLIVSHREKAWSPLVIDVEGYKHRRAEALRALAIRMAEQVRSRGTSFSLEPMPAYERRIIHITLADQPGVSTESTGEGEFRKVVILPEQG